MRIPRHLAIAVALLSCVVSSACGSGGDAAGPSPTTPQGEITVAAASSLHDALTAIAVEFEATFPGSSVDFNVGASSALAQQVLSGAPTDVFVSADRQTIQSLDDAGQVDGPAEVIAQNRLVIVTPRGNPAGVRSFRDLDDAGVVSLCVQTAPCGRLAEDLLRDAGVEIAEGSVSRGQNATATLTAVSEGDAVAGLVYATDALSQDGSVATVALPTSSTNATEASAASLTDASNPDLAAAFVEFLLSDEAQAILTTRGFEPPS